MTMEVKPLHPKKAYPPMLVTLSGMTMEVKPLHPEKAPSPMLVTLSGIIVLLHPADGQVDSTLLGHIQFIPVLHILRVLVVIA